ncbi:hypothetical protein RLEG12_00050 (plasmid) [Rhizobium leguminosarum bv. trifolii CB782]|nr:hypothetical protein RLEG12_00050 [Rhizobium leguminosarum bv. trifolii CB782]
MTGFADLFVGEGDEWEPLVVTPKEHLISDRHRANRMALDLEITRRVFDLIESSEGDMDLMEKFRTSRRIMVEAAKRSGGAIFPDGIAVLGLDEDLSYYSRISVKPPAQAAPALVETELPTGALVVEGIPLTAARSYTSPTVTSLGKPDAALPHSRIAMGV